MSDFWLDGDLVVSPVEQFAFLQRFFAGKLPAAARHLAAVENVLRLRILLSFVPRREPNPAHAW